MKSYHNKMTSAVEAYNAGIGLERLGKRDDARIQFTVALTFYQNAYKILLNQKGNLNTEILKNLLDITETRCQLIEGNPTGISSDTTNLIEFELLQKEMDHIKNQAQIMRLASKYEKRINRLEIHIRHKKYISTWNRALQYLETPQPTSTTECEAFFMRNEKGIELAMTAIQLLSSPNNTRHTIHSYNKTTQTDAEEAYLRQEWLLQLWDHYINTLSELEKSNPSLKIFLLEKIFRESKNLLLFFEKTAIKLEPVHHFSALNALEDLYNLNKVTKQYDYLTLFATQLEDLRKKYSLTDLKALDALEFLSYELFYQQQINADSITIQTTLKRIFSISPELEKSSQNEWVTDFLKKARQLEQTFVEKKEVPALVTQTTKVDAKPTYSFPAGSRILKRKTPSSSSTPPVAAPFFAPNKTIYALMNSSIQLEKLRLAKDEKPGNEILAGLCTVIAKSMEEKLIPSASLNSEQLALFHFYLFSIYKLAIKLFPNSEAQAKYDGYKKNHPRIAPSHHSKEEDIYADQREEWTTKLASLNSNKHIGPRLKIIFELCVAKMEMFTEKKLKNTLLDILLDTLNLWIGQEKITQPARKKNTR